MPGGLENINYNCSENRRSSVESIPLSAALSLSLWLLREGEEKKGTRRWGAAIKITGILFYVRFCIIQIFVPCDMLRFNFVFLCRVLLFKKTNIYLRHTKNVKKITRVFSTNRVWRFGRSRLNRSMREFKWFAQAVEKIGTISLKRNNSHRKACGQKHNVSALFL